MEWVAWNNGTTSYNPIDESNSAKNWMKDGGKPSGMLSFKPQILSKPGASQFSPYYFNHKSTKNPCFFFFFFFFQLNRVNLEFMSLDSVESSNWWERGHQVPQDYALFHPIIALLERPYLVLLIKSSAFWQWVLILTRILGPPPSTEID